MVNQLTQLNQFIDNKDEMIQFSNNFKMGTKYLRSAMNLAINNSRYLKIENDCVNTFLPYFGVLHSNVGNYGNGSISINNAIESYKVFYNDVKKKISIKLKGYKNLEAFNIILEVYVGGAASLSIFGSNRSTICYDGIIHKVK